MRRAFYTHWTLPRRTPGSGYEHDWPTRAHAYLAWALSTTLAARHVGPVEIMTDAEGADDLAWIGLPAMLRVGLGDDLRPLVRFWTAGKLATYGLASQIADTFVHLDNDVFLTQPLPDAIWAQTLGVQSVEPLTLPNYAGYYLPTMEALEARFDVPIWAMDTAARLEDRPAYNLGLLVANDAGRSVLADTATHGLAMLFMAAELATDLPPSNVCVVAEQYTFGAVARVRGVPVTPLIPDAATPDGQAHAARLGYVHLFGAAKRDAAALDRLVRRARRECPNAYQRIVSRFPL
ncbi:MAG: hypothetical protein LCH53_04445 [Bacteroidetes bacterium]|nr:hypothetical protein [Bacteroidota bacterium]